MKRLLAFWPLYLFGVLIGLAISPMEQVQRVVESPAFAQQKQISKPAHGTGYIPLTPEKRKFYQAISNAQHGNRIAMMAKNQTLPSSFDARTRYPLPVWDQGPCGSCFLVSTVRTATCALGLAGFGKPDGSFMLSAQYGMDSPRDFGGCGGGNGTEVIDWMIKHGWPAETYVDASGTVHKDYPPYSAREGRDRMVPGAKMWMKDATWGFVGDGTPTVEEIKAALVNFGRLNIAIDAGGQFGNGTGTITSLGNGIDHEINVVAYDDNKDGGAVLLENQWSTDWGNGGYRWCTYKAATHIVDWFFVSAGQLPPVPPPPPFTVPLKLYETAVLVGNPAGYLSLASAEKYGKEIAAKDNKAVTIKDADGKVVETIPPPPPPPPPAIGTVTITVPAQTFTVGGQGYSYGLFGRRQGVTPSQTITLPAQTITAPVYPVSK